MLPPPKGVQTVPTAYGNHRNYVDCCKIQSKYYWVLGKYMQPVVSPAHFHLYQFWQCVLVHKLKDELMLNY